MLDVVKKRRGPEPGREAIAMRETQARGLVVADQVALECALCFVCLEERGGAVMASASGALGVSWVFLD